MKKSVKQIAGVLIVIAIVIYGIFRSMQPMDAEIIEVQPQTIAQQVKEEGIVVSSQKRLVYATINGVIEKLLVEEGQVVSEGDVLVEINTDDLKFQLEQQKAQRKSLQAQENISYNEMEQQLAQLRGQLESIKGQERQAYRGPYEAQIQQQKLKIEDTENKLAAARTEHEKLKMLYKAGAISEEKLINSSNYIKQLENQLQQQKIELQLIEQQAEPAPGTEQYYQGQKNALETQIALIEEEIAKRKSGGAPTRQYYQGMIEAVDAQIKQLEKQIAEGKIISPITGIVEEIHMKEGAMVSPQTLMLTLLGTSHHEIEVYLLTEDVIGVQEGMNVTLIQERRDGDLEFEGRVISIAPSAVDRVSALGLTEQRVKVTVQPEGKVPELRPGYALDVQFTVFQQENKLAVPKGSLFPYEDGEALWVVRNGRAEIQAVKTGLKTDEQVVIEEGLQPGDKIIKDPGLEGLKIGKRVK